VPVPATESLKITLERVLPYWSAEIEPHLQRGETVLVAAHGNSLRAIVKHLFSVSEQDIVGVEIPTANPLVIDLSPDARSVVGARYLDTARAQALPQTGR
jgi:2,3-bisphosphoglycerate-dependent phosphoglycerate mutase